MEPADVDGERLSFSGCELELVIGNDEGIIRGMKLAVFDGLDVLFCSC